MGRSGLECCAVFLIVSCVFALIIAEEHNGNDQLTNTAVSRDLQWYVRRKPGVWLTPRVGRKKRSASPYEENNYRTPSFDREQLESLMDTVQEPPWTLVTINEGKRHTVNFTPRLGRESGEENEPDSWLHDTDLNRELMSQRSPPFAPRLGRRMNTYYFDPRLGKRNSNSQKQLL
ncbi:hypothetical protein ILUMI_20566 [Ignelater luminosus]|uniref:Uncharacterized protein n=1 Tax=Ignelater luminosus TaxID=2038154 RepID=A0A8K0CE34_IGNLU|nr:hypothetical protein ILUMI_20566 [Ignelater luminosus]